MSQGKMDPRKLLKHFRKAMEYDVVDGKPVVVFEDDDLLEKEGVVYARFYDGDVIYIGSTSRTLRARLKEHRSDGYRKRYPAYWEWADGKRITVKAFCPPEAECAGISIPAYDGVEKALTREFKPRFAKIGKGD